MTRRAVYPFIEKTGYPAKYSAKPYNRGQKPRKTHVCSCLDLFIAEIKIWFSVKYVSRRWGKWPDVRHSATPDIQFLISRISGRISGIGIHYLVHPYCRVLASYDLGKKTWRYILCSYQVPADMGSCCPGRSFCRWNCPHRAQVQKGWSTPSLETVRFFKYIDLVAFSLSFGLGS